MQIPTALVQPASPPTSRPVQPGSASVTNPAARARLRRAAREFEALLVEHMLKTARASAPGKALLGQGAGHDVYQGIADEQFARSLSQGRGLGLGDLLYRGLLRTDQKRPSSPGSSGPIQDHRETPSAGRAAL